MISLAICCLIGWAQQFHAPQAETELVPSTIGIEAGRPFQVALHMKMAPGFHSYFINPGESGMATKIDWQLPEGFKAGPIRWPTPERIVVGGVAGYVYEKEVWLVTDITPPPTAWDTQKEPLIRANVTWLLCREACVPQHSSLWMVVHQTDEIKPNPAFAPAARSLSTNAQGLVLNARIKDKTALLTVKQQGGKASSVKFFPGDPTYFGADIPTITSTSSGIEVEVPLSRYAPAPPTRLTGLLVLPPSDGRGSGAHWIDIQVTKS